MTGSQMTIELVCRKMKRQGDEDDKKQADNMTSCLPADYKYMLSASSAELNAFILCSCKQQIRSDFVYKVLQKQTLQASISLQSELDLTQLLCKFKLSGFCRRECFACWDAHEQHELLLAEF